jgi:hypothetical protein
MQLKETECGDFLESDWQTIIYGMSTVLDSPLRVYPLRFAVQGGRSEAVSKKKSRRHFGCFNLIFLIMLLHVDNLYNPGFH